MNDVTKLLEIASKSSVPVLLCGESGTGKEVAARNLHFMGARSKGPFIPVNCGALNPGLIESLFEGSCRGAFTGSVSSQLGFVRAADKGTLFLDEIGELPLESQTRLLRILQERSVTPVGSQISIPVDFRLVCATHRNLEDAVKNGRFREDLFFRLNVFPIRLLPLRDRRGELKMIANELWNELSPRTLNAGELQKLASFPWPGNVRQLKNVLNRYCLLECLGNSLDSVLASEPWDLHSLRPYSVGDIRQGYRCRSVSPSWNRIESVLKETSSNKSRAAKILGISRGALCYQVRKHSDGSKTS